MLEAKYEKADLPSVVQENCPHLTEDQSKASLKLLQDMRVYLRVNSERGKMNSYILI